MRNSTHLTPHAILFRSLRRHTFCRFSFPFFSLQTAISTAIHYLSLSQFLFSSSSFLSFVCEIFLFRVQRKRQVGELQQQQQQQPVPLVPPLGRMLAAQSASQRSHCRSLLSSEVVEWSGVEEEEEGLEGFESLCSVGSVPGSAAKREKRTKKKLKGDSASERPASARLRQSGDRRRRRTW